MTQILSVRWISSLDTKLIIKETFESPSQDFIQMFQKDIGDIWEVFRVTRNGCIWNIHKSHLQIQQFIIIFNQRFKTSLVFDRFIQEGIKVICQNQDALVWSPFKAFLQVEETQIEKIGSFVLLKKAGGRFKNFICCSMPWQWHQRNFIIIKTGIFYYSESTKKIKEYFPFGKSFRIQCGKEKTGYQLGISLEDTHRKLMLLTPDSRLFCKFIYLVKQTIRQTELPQKNRFQSFAPKRQIHKIQFLVDAQRYFNAVYEALSRAQWQIMICGWWLSPQLQLRRPIDKYPSSRLDNVLKTAADRGVKIYILVYNESILLDNNSTYTQQALQKLSPNIKVLLHPLGVLPMLWSHHQKIVIVDQSYVLMGGLDLCYGRFDTSQHLITHNDPNWFPGIDYNNIRRTKITNVREFWKQSVPRDVARLPWHDIGVHFTGEAIHDVCHHFIQYWNYASYQANSSKKNPLILQKGGSHHLLAKRIKECTANKIQNIKGLANQLKQKLQKKTNKDQSHFESNQPIQIKSSFKTEVKPELIIQLQPKGRQMLMIEIKNESNTLQTQESDLKKHFTSGHQNNFRTRSNNSLEKIKRQNFQKKELEDIVQKMEDQIQQIGQINDIRIKNSKKKFEQTLPLIRVQQEDLLAGFRCQVLRSVGSWSIGCDPQIREQSIQNAYIQLILSSKHFIYIENQCFVSAGENNGVVKNQIANALYNRVLKAHYQNELFKVYIVLPLILGFAGDLDDSQAELIRIFMHWQYSTISRGENSLFARLKLAGVNPEDFMAFFSLRTHAISKGVRPQPITEIIYVHTKLMIVDDFQVMIGSSNINDRSMQGSRDSEIGLYLQGKPTTRSTLAKKAIFVNKTIKHLRLQLWKEHFGSDLDYEDPSSKECFNAIKRRAKKNSQMYRVVFHCYPDNRIKNLVILKEWKQLPCNQQFYKNWFGEVKGFAVQFPLQFLQEEDLLVGSALYPDILSV